jgi:hypothetical protein
LQDISLATRVETATGTAQDAQERYFRVTDQVPEEVWYWAALASIIVSASLFLLGKRDWSIFGSSSLKRWATFSE